jgi:hypothetical protein
MKKLLLSLCLASFAFVGVFAQFNFNTNTNIGQKLSSVNTADKDTFLVDFNTAIASASWTYNSETDVYTVVNRKCQTQRGLQIRIYADDIATDNGLYSSDFECRDYGANRNPQHVQSLDSLLSVLNVFDIQLSTANSKSKPAHCLFDINGDAANQAFGAYPATYKRVEYGYRFNFAGKSVQDDITFDIDTYNAGNTGKTATYKMEVYQSSVSEANKIGEVASLYVTGSGKQTISVASAIGLTPAAFSNKAIFILVKTKGTTNSAGQLDALPNATDVMDPIIVFDNIYVTYQNPLWEVPQAIANTYFNFNNGNPVATISTDYSGGNPVPVYVDQDNDVKIYLKGKSRLQNLNIKEGNDGGGHSSKFSIAATGAVKQKVGDTYSSDVAYTYTPYDGNTNMIFSLDIAAPTAGSVDDDLELTLTASNVSSGMTPTLRLEITNGVRFWYNIAVTGTLHTSAQTVDLNNTMVLTTGKSIFVMNATDNVVITNISGQRIKTISASEAVNGITVQSGLYIVKTGSFVQKVLVK